MHNVRLTKNNDNSQACCEFLQKISDDVNSSERKFRKCCKIRKNRVLFWESSNQATQHFPLNFHRKKNYIFGCPDTSPINCFLCVIPHASGRPARGPTSHSTSTRNRRLLWDGCVRRASGPDGCLVFRFFVCVIRYLLRIYFFQIMRVQIVTGIKRTYG